MPSSAIQKQRVTQAGHQITIGTAQSISHPASKSGAVNKRTHDQLNSTSESHSVSVTINPRNDLPLVLSTPSIKYRRVSEVQHAHLGCPGLQGGNSIDPKNQVIASTSVLDIDPTLLLSHPAYGLPEKLVQNFSLLGISNIYPWQSKCLLGGSLLTGEGNLIYTAPTGGGKSLVADVLMLKQILDNPRKKAILVLPYVALVQEKLSWLRRAVDGITRKTTMTEHHPSLRYRKCGEDCVRIVGFFGGSKSRACWEDMDIAVCTIEKANALVNTAIEECTVSQIGIIVMDELHMVDDDHRGYLMEIMATKLLSLDQGIQIIGMSATISLNMNGQNIETLARWLKAKYCISNYHPVPIDEYLVYENTVYAVRTSKRFVKATPNVHSRTSPEKLGGQVPLKKIQTLQHPDLSNPVLNSVVALAIETARAGYGALIFCSSRAGCESDAILISQFMPELFELSREVLERRTNLLSELRSTPNASDLVLERTIPRGVAFHHAGLTTEEREMIAEGYDHGILKVIVATCSLAAGINLPARRVILHGARMGRELIGPSMLRQMRGRAGRKGKDELGETYLCCQQGDLPSIIELIDADLPRVTSSLAVEKRGIERALLEVIAINLATSALALGDYVRNTLLYQTMDHETLDDLAKSSLENLVAIELIKADSMSTYQATRLGKAIVMSSFSPRDGIFIFKELKRAVQAFVMDGDMHFIYTVTPIQWPQVEINWQIFRKEVELLDVGALRVLEFVGIKPAFVNKMAQGGCFKKKTQEDFEAARTHQRFYAAFQLRDLCNEVPIHVVARKYEIPRGNVQNLAQSCQGFAAGIVKFCERLEWGALAVVLDHMCDRLKAGARSDLLNLAQVTFIKSRTARVFWDNGYRNVGAVAAATVDDLTPILLLAHNKKIRLHPEDDRKYHQKLRLRAETIIQSAARVMNRLMQQGKEEDD